MYYAHSILTLPTAVTKAGSASYGRMRLICVAGVPYSAGGTHLFVDPVASTSSC